VTTQHYAFGNFELFPRQRLLMDRGQVVSLGSRALELLTALVENRGEVVSKEALIAKVWPGVWVEESSLRVHVGAVRKALRDGQDGNRYVANIPGRGYSFVGEMETREDPALAPPVAAARPTHSHALPTQLTRVVGREEIIRTLAEYKPRRRFLTIAGPGGIGKTTVALSLARELRASFREGVLFVDLSTVSSPDFVAGTLAAALNVTVHPDDPISSLAAALRDKEILIVLDSCEHVVEAAANMVDGLLRYTEGVSVIATSREALRGEGEWVQRIPTLAAPPEGAVSITAAKALRFPAVQLLVDRAAEHLGGYVLSDADAPFAAEICRKLDGIALAIELAAGRTDTISLYDLASQIDDRFKLLKSGRRTALPRHQTLRATLDWSYDRLVPGERVLLNRLSIFHGSFTFEAATIVCAGGTLESAFVSDIVADLVAKSLVVAQFERDEVLYRLLDTTRAYAREKLDDSGEREKIARRHSHYICSMFESAATLWEAQPSEQWAANYTSQIENLRAALNWCFGPNGDPGTGIALTIFAVPLWSQLSMIDESFDWVEKALGASAALPEQQRRRQMQLNAALGGLQMYAISSIKQANNAWKTALGLAVELGDVDYQLRSLRALWAEAINQGKFDYALTVARRFQNVAIADENALEIVVADRLIACALNYIGEIVQSADIIERMLRNYRTTAARSDLVRFQFNQKLSARIVRDRSLWLLGYPDSALRGLGDNVDEALDLGHTMTICNVLTQCGCPVALLAQDQNASKRYVDLLAQRTAPNALDTWHAYAICYRAEMEIDSGNVEHGLDLLEPAMEELKRSGFGHYRTSFLNTYARAQLLLGQPGIAADAIREALEICEITGGKWNLAELHRWRGEIAVAMATPTALTTVEDAFTQALDIARRQGAFSWEIRASTSLGRWLIGQGRKKDADSLLQDVYSRCKEGFERPDIIALRTLLLS
jgi:predicted ATPase/DNA-binding winged helix-turn-helix (wHTH) protein